MMISSDGKVSMGIQKKESRGTRYIYTVSGKKVYPFNVTPEMIYRVDIAAGLSKIPRFMGQVKRFYSVAQHTLNMLVLSYKEPEYIHIRDQVSNMYPGNPSLFDMCILLHDASEAYLGDIPSPIKRGLPDYLRLEEKIQRAIHLRFGGDVEDARHKLAIKSAIRNMDRRLVISEHYWLTGEIAPWSHKMREKGVRPIKSFGVTGEGYHLEHAKTYQDYLVLYLTALERVMNGGSGVGDSS